ncbi:hypothetical protein DFS33DRAFT_1454566 [Desarmillaria ectypa]|nr:hypothetical protein DFS33DRAFT_1454566 [Desarmillaria ectypa]
MVHCNSLLSIRTMPRCKIDHGIEITEVPYDYAICAMGSYLPALLDLWGTPEERDYDGTKGKAIQWLKEKVHDRYFCSVSWQEDYTAPFEGRGYFLGLMRECTSRLICTGQKTKHFLAQGHELTHGQCANRIGMGLEDTPTLGPEFRP